MKLRQFFLFLCLITTATFPVMSQEKILEKTWEVLSDVTFETEVDEEGELYVPKFGEKVAALNGENIKLKGFLIPFEGMFAPTHIILSSLPIASCFFCGSGGPETVVEAYLKTPTKYTTKRVQVEGRLELNDTDYDQLMYIIKDATVSIY